MDSIYRNTINDRIRKVKVSSQNIVTPSWIPVIAIIIAVLSTTLWLLWQTPAEFPMGDSYIHFVYARNLAEHHEFSYNLGSNEGIGTTSFLWVAILAAFQIVGLSPEVSAKVLG